jgi:hypothetical protein
MVSLCLETTISWLTTTPLVLVVFNIIYLLLALKTQINAFYTNLFISLHTKINLYRVFNVLLVFLNSLSFTFSCAYTTCLFLSLPSDWYYFIQLNLIAHSLSPSNFSKVKRTTSYSLLLCSSLLQNLRQPSNLSHNIWDMLVIFLQIWIC